MYQQVTICLSALTHHLHITHLINKAASAPYTTSCHSVVAQLPIPYHLGATCKEKEHFSTAPLDDHIWMEQPVPCRHLCIHEHSQHDLCPYPCPYSLDQIHLAPDYALTPQYMDLSDIINFPDMITTTSDKDIPNLEDVLKL